MVTSYGRWVVRWRWWIVAVSLLLSLAAAAGVQFLQFSADYRVFFSADNPQLQAYEALQNVFSQEDNILFVLQRKGGDVFDPRMLRAVQELTEASWKIPYATRVTSITNFQSTAASGDDLVVADLVERPAALTADDIARIRGIAMSEPLLVNRLISSDGRTTAINVSAILRQRSMQEVPATMAAARQMVAEFQARYPEIRVATTGLVALSKAVSEVALHDLATLTPAMYGAILIALLVFLRSFSGTLAALVIILLSTLVAMGLTGWLGIPVTPPSAMAPTIILTLAVAYSVHVMVTMFAEIRAGKVRHEAIIESLRINVLPVFLTGVTTVIGYLGLNFSDSPPHRALGNTTAIGITVACILSLFLLPALLAILPMRVARPRDLSAPRLMARLTDTVIGWRRPLLWGTSLAILGLALAIPRIELDDRFVDNFDPSVPFRADTDFVMQNLGSMYTIDFDVRSGKPGGISEPDYLLKVESFAKWLLDEPGVVHVNSLTDILRRLNKNMHGDDPSYYRLPEDHDTAAQYLLLYEMSLPYGLDLNNQINVDKSALRITATLGNISTREGRELKERAEAWLAQNLPSSAATRAASPFIMFAFISQRNIDSMLSGTLLALVLITAAIMLELRSIRYGLLSIIPNLIPMIASAGIWAILYGRMGMFAAVFVSASLGIVDDNTIHFLSHYVRARRERRADAEGAIRYAFSTVGMAILVNAVVLVVGFLILGLSKHAINRNLALLTAITIFVATIVVFLLLPPLLLALKPRLPRTAKEKERPAYETP